MDGYNQYPWNQCYDQYGMVYPPQNEEFGYDNGRNYDFNYQMPQVPFHYQDWRNNDEWSYASTSKDFQLHQDNSCIYSSPKKGLSIRELMMRRILRGEPFGSSLHALAIFMDHIQEAIQQQEPLGFTSSEVIIIVENLKKEMTKLMEEENEEQKEESPIYHCIEEACEPMEHKLRELLMEGAYIEEQVVMKEFEDGEELSNEVLSIEPKEYENQEASNDTLKSEMSISILLNSSIYYFLDKNVSIDFVLPLDSFDQKKDVVRMLGILYQRRNVWMKIKMKDEGDRSTFHWRLVDEEAQSASLLLYYAYLKTNAYMIVIINGIGCVIETIYIFIFVIYAPKKARIRTMSLIFLFNVGGLGVIMLVSLLCVKAGSHRVALVGWICVAFNLAVFVAPFSIMRQVVRTKSVEFMPFTLSLFLTLCATMWFFYGFFIKDYYIAFPNIIGFIFGIAQMILYLVYKNAKKDDTSKLELDPSKNIEKNLDPEEANHIGNVSK
ncbi:hypothetical protein ACS0TY_025684 [Phlomoides rotata]